MAENSNIEWTTHTFNPWRGCTKVSPGCAHCYADTMSKRNPLTLGVWGPNGTRVVASESMWREPLKWDKAAKAAGERHRVFCASLADVFEDWTGPMVDAQGRKLWATGLSAVPWIASHNGDEPPNPDVRPLTMADVRHRLFRVMHETANLDWLLLTKRPERIERGLSQYAETIDTYMSEAFSLIWNRRVWLGTSVEDKAAKKRIDVLRTLPAAVRFLSVEPLLEDLGTVDLAGIDWVIVGGESGPDARPCDVAWVRSLVGQCKAASVPVFVKQLGSNPYTSELWDVLPGSGKVYQSDELKRDPALMAEVCERLGLLLANSGVELRDRKGGDPAEWPADLRVRQFPSVEAAR